MNKRILQATMLVAVGMLLPFLSNAQSTDGSYQLSQVLERVYDDMMPLCSRLIDVGRGLAGFAALWYIAVRVWRHIANAEPIDFFPLLRPFAIGMCILLFPHVLSLMNGVLKPTVTATAAMVGDSQKAIRVMLEMEEQGITDPQAYEQVEEAVRTNPEKWDKYTSTGDGSAPNPIARASFGFGFKAMIKQAIADMLYLFYQAAALVLNTIRTFKLIVLALLGPLVFGLSVFDGFQHTLKHWLARYVNVFLWLPIANIFGAIISRIQENMIRMEMTDGHNDFFHSTNTAYLIFLIIAIVGYFTVPSIANYIVHAGGHALLAKTSSLIASGTSIATGLVISSLMKRERDPGAKQPNGGPYYSGPRGSSTATGSYLRSRISGKSG